MPTPHLFSLPHAQLDDQTAPDAGVTRSRSRRKRRASQLDDTDGDGRDDAISPDSTLNELSQETTTFTSLTALEHAQLRTAGLRPGDQIPPSPFPHQRPSSRAYILRDVKRELETVKPPIPHLDASYYVPLMYKTNKERTTLREQHVAVLTTVLHQMLQKGDYKRAGRAWALLLRSGHLARHLRKVQGVEGMDLRTHERWGIGAELLMRTKADAGEPSLVDTSDGYLDYSEEGFRLARQYYERLIVQYPPGHHRKGASSSTFYSAMFSMWIYEVIQQRRHGQPPHVHSGGLRRAERSRSASFSSISTDGEEDHPQLRDAKEIAKRMDDIVSVPPYDHNGQLLQMRGMVELWIADLTDLSETQRIEAMVQATTFFIRAQRNGVELTEQTRNLIAKFEEEGEDDEIIESEGYEEMEDAQMSSE